MLYSEDSKEHTSDAFMLIIQAHCYLLEIKFRTFENNNKSTWLHTELVLESTQTGSRGILYPINTKAFAILSVNNWGFIFDRHMKFGFFFRTTLSSYVQCMLPFHTIGRTYT